MAVTTAPFTAANLVGFIPKIWTPIVNEELFAARVFAAFCMDLSPYAQDGSDTLHVPDVFTNTFTVQTQSTQGAEITTNNPAQNDTTLSINTHKYVAYLIGDKDAKQLWRSYDFNGIYARKAGRKMGDTLEAAIAALWSSLTTNSVGATSAAVSDLNIRQAINKLAGGNFPLDECEFFFHPTAFWTQIVALQKFYDQGQAGRFSGEGATRSGNMGGVPLLTETQSFRGFLYGIPVAVTTNVVSALQTFRNLLLHKSCFGFALQTQGPFGGARVQTDYLLQNIGLLAVVDMIYGTGVLRDPGGVQINTNNAATVA